jgi:twitching motility protein PilT
MKNPKQQFDTLLATCVEKSGSDMHLTSDEPICYRIHGVLTTMDGTEFSAKDVQEMAQAIMSEKQLGDFLLNRSLDMGYFDPAGERFRINCYFSMDKPTMAVRHLDQNLLSLEELLLPSQLRGLASHHSGLVLVTGSTGSGKSSTLAVLLDEINKTRNCHILTIEDPVEFVHKNKKGIVHHREVHTDVPSYADAMRAALREDPDVIMVGEMRDLETMQAAITAAETGHLVFSTLHTGEAIGAIERFIGHFGGEEQSVARHRLGMVLKAVIAQRLVEKIDGKGRVPVVELLSVNTAVANMIQSSKTRQIYSMMESSGDGSMWTLDQDLAKLVKNNIITKDVALRTCNDRTGFDRLVNVAQRGNR